MDTECIIWQGALQSRGYGSVAVGDGSGRSMLAHRKAWIAKHGEIEDGMTVDHLCRVRACVNTDHMEIVTREENIRRAQEYRREQRRGEAGTVLCAQGHEQTEGNVRVYVTKKGAIKNVCKPCTRAAYRAWYWKNKQAAA